MRGAQALAVRDKPRAGGLQGHPPTYPLQTLAQVQNLYCAGGQALAARGEPLLSGFETAPADFAAYWRPHGWSVAALLDAKCAAPRTSSAWTSMQAGDKLGFHACCLKRTSLEADNFERMRQLTRSL